MEQKGERALEWVLVAILIAAGFGLRLAYTLRVPPFLDEYSSMLTGLSILSTGGIPRLPSGVLYPSGSLFSYLEALFFQLFGFSDFVARLPSLLISVLTLPVLYLVARNLLGRRAVLLSVALLAFTPEAVVWGGRARMYAALQLLVLLTVFAFYRSVIEPRVQPEQRAKSGFLWVLLFLASIFSQDEAILLLPILWLAALVAQGPRRFLRPASLLVQVALPAAGVVARYWLNRIRVPGEVLIGVHNAFFRFPPTVAHGLRKITPFFLEPWAWPVTVLFCLALALILRGLLKRGAVRLSPGGLSIAPGEAYLAAPAFLAYVLLAVAAAMVLVVNTPWQDDRYLFMVLPLFFMTATWGLDQVLVALVGRWPWLRSQWVTPVLVLLVALAGLPAGLSTLRRFEPDYSAAYQWLATQRAATDLVASVRPAPAAVYLGQADFLVAEDRHQEFIMRLNGVWIDRWAGAKVLESPEAFRQEALQGGQPVWFVIDEDRFESVSYSPEFVALILQQMELVWHEGGVLVFRGQGYHPPPEMEVTRQIDANFGDQLRLTGAALSTDQPEPGQEVTLHLYWRAIRPERDYTVFVHVKSADGQGLTQLDGEPLLGLYSMATHWPRDRDVLDERQLVIPADTPPGRYRLEVGLYDGADPNLERLPVVDEAGNVQGDSLTLGFLQVDVLPPPEPSVTLEAATLGQVVRLVGYDPALPAAVTAGTALPLTLTWECLEEMDSDYTVFVHLASGDEPPVAQADGQPVDGTYPTSYWRVGERVQDRHLLEIPADAPAGEYDLLVGMYLLATGDRLPLLSADGQVLGDQILLGRLRIAAP